MEYLNIRDYGAVGDGVADDTEALTAAMADAEKTCGTVLFPGGNYRIRPVKVPSHITLLAHAAWGYNYGVRPAPNVLDLEHCGKSWLTPQNRDAEALLDLSGCVGTRLIGISIDGALYGEERQPILAGQGDGHHAYKWENTPDFAGVVAHGGEQLMFEEFRVVTTPGDCVRLENVKGFAFRKSILTRSRGRGVAAIDCENGVVIDTQAAYNIGSGVYAKNTSGFRILANRIEGGHPSAVNLEGCDTCTVNGNSFDCPWGMGTILSDCVGVAVGGNMYRGCGNEQEGELDTHMALYRCSGCSVTGNTMWSFTPFSGENVTANCYILEDLTDCVVTGNCMFNACLERTVWQRGTMNNTVIADNVGIPVDFDHAEHAGWYQGDFKESDKTDKS